MKSKNSAKLTKEKKNAIMRNVTEHVMAVQSMLLNNCYYYYYYRLDRGNATAVILLRQLATAKFKRKLKTFLFESSYGLNTSSELRNEPPV